MATSRRGERPGWGGPSSCQWVWFLHDMTLPATISGGGTRRALEERRSDGHHHRQPHHPEPTRVWIRRRLGWRQDTRGHHGSPGRCFPGACGRADDTGERTGQGRGHRPIPECVGSDRVNVKFAVVDRIDADGHTAPDATETGVELRMVDRLKASTGFIVVLERCVDGRPRGCPGSVVSRTMGNGCRPRSSDTMSWQGVVRSVAPSSHCPQRGLGSL
jgi:hypothetical protein